MENKRKYEKPLLDASILLLEQGIAAGSAEVNVGVDTMEHTPKVEEWESGWSNTPSRDFDL